MYGEQASKLTFEINGITEEISQYIEDMDDFYLTIKKYLYTNRFSRCKVCRCSKIWISGKYKKIGNNFKIK